MAEIEAAYRESLEATGSREKFDSRKQEIALERLRDCVKAVRAAYENISDDAVMKRAGEVFWWVIQALLEKLDHGTIQVRHWMNICKPGWFTSELIDDAVDDFRERWFNEMKPEGAVRRCGICPRSWIVETDDPAMPLRCTSGKTCSTVKQGLREWTKCTIHLRSWIVKTHAVHWDCSSGDPACACAAQVTKEKPEEQAKERAAAERCARERKEAERLAAEAEVAAELAELEAQGYDLQSGGDQWDEGETAIGLFGSFSQNGEAEQERLKPPDRLTEEELDAIAGEFFESETAVVC
jgi:hypothetical protein